MRKHGAFAQAMLAAVDAVGGKPPEELLAMMIAAFADLEPRDVPESIYRDAAALEANAAELIRQAQAAMRVAAAAGGIAAHLHAAAMFLKD